MPQAFCKYISRSQQFSIYAKKPGHSRTLWILPTLKNCFLIPVWGSVEKNKIRVFYNFDPVKSTEISHHRVAGIPNYICVSLPTEICSIPTGRGEYWFNLGGTQTLERLMAAWDAKTPIQQNWSQRFGKKGFPISYQCHFPHASSTNPELDQRPSWWMMWKLKAGLSVLQKNISSRSCLTRQRVEVQWWHYYF